MTRDSDEPFTDKEFEEFVATVVEDPWEASRDADPLHDISIIHPEQNREVLIDSARHRLSYRDTDTGTWGLQQKPVTDLNSAVTKLITVALNVPMNEMHYLGLETHPDPPEDPSFSYEEYDEGDDPTVPNGI